MRRLVLLRRDCGGLWIDGRSPAARGHCAASTYHAGGVQAASVDAGYTITYSGVHDRRPFGDMDARPSRRANDRRARGRTQCRRRAGRGLGWRWRCGSVRHRRARRPRCAAAVVERRGAERYQPHRDDRRGRWGRAADGERGRVHPVCTGDGSEHEPGPDRADRSAPRHAHACSRRDHGSRSGARCGRRRWIQ